MRQISVPLPWSVCCTKHLHIWSWAALKVSWTNTSQRHDTDSEKGYRIEEHLLTANLLVDKTTLHDMPVRIARLDLSKVFDRVCWPSLWSALSAHGVSQHLIWILHSVYVDQVGEIQMQA